MARSWAGGAPLALLALLAACGAGAGPGRGEVTRGEVAAPSARSDAAAPAAESAGLVLSYLSDDFERVFPGRIRLARHGAVWFRAGDERPAVDEEGGEIDLPSSPELVVVEDRGARLRVVADEDSARLLLWIAAGDLRTVIVEPTGLAAGPGEPAAVGTAPGVRALPGVPVVVEQRLGEERRITMTDGCATASGWVADEKLGRVYVPVEAPDGEGDGISVAPGSAVVERPGGQVVARFIETCSAQVTGPEEGGFVPILYRGRGFEVRGWVQAGQTKGGGGMLGGLGYLRSADRFQLPAGTCLYAGQRGELVGVVTEDRDETSAELEDGGWWRVEMATSWGDLPVWVAEVEPVAEESEEEKAADGGGGGGGGKAIAGGALEGGAPRGLWSRRTIEHGPLRRCR